MKCTGLSWFSVNSQLISTYRPVTKCPNLQAHIQLHNLIKKTGHLTGHLKYNRFIYLKPQVVIRNTIISSEITVQLFGKTMPLKDCLISSGYASLSLHLLTRHHKVCLQHVAHHSAKQKVSFGNFLHIQFKKYFLRKRHSFLSLI